ncbi:hypothetical protein HanPSC8_Chr15g0674951 [Helianthus annuus]|nr:hypothetical protein HanPSC8_Chr15g0674951 [Helianthus annuus]
MQCKILPYTYILAATQLSTTANSVLHSDSSSGFHSPQRLPVPASGSQFRPPAPSSGFGLPVTNRYVIFVSCTYDTVLVCCLICRSCSICSISAVSINLLNLFNLCCFKFVSICTIFVDSICSISVVSNSVNLFNLLNLCC